MNWETVIGLETHVELATRTKIFCGCTTAFGGAPNTHCCPICTGMPGTLPTLNEKVLEYAVKAGVALNAEITKFSRFDRKNYFYPDLPKSYQISQLYLPIARNGAVTLKSEQSVRIHELHMEEDAGKLIHGGTAGKTGADDNRCGIPLIEIVTEPDFRCAEDVLDYLEQLKSMLQYLGVSDCKLQEGSLRCDVNLSVRPVGSGELGVRTEIKNLGSFRAVSRAIAFEAARQIVVLERGGQVKLETRRWNEEKDQSVAMRGKEDVSEYRYFPEPDLPPIRISHIWLESLRADIPEFAREKCVRYRREYGLSEYDAETLTARRELALFFEDTVALGAQPKEAANWIMGPFLRKVSEQKTEIKDICFTPEALARLISLVDSGTLNRNTAAAVLDAVFETNADVDTYCKAHGLEQISDAGAAARIVAAVMAENQKSVEDYHAGKEKAFGFLMGQAMRSLRGKGDPQVIRMALEQALNQN